MDEHLPDDLEGLLGDHLPDVLIEGLMDEVDWDVPAACHEAAHRGRLFGKLYEVGHEYGVEHEDLAKVAALAWVMGGLPHLEPAAWRELFDRAGYCELDDPVARPSQPLRLWRGGLPEHKYNWSWTDDPDLAYHYAGPLGVVRDIGMIWTATVEPWRLMAALPMWSEYVVDTAGLDVHPFGLWCRCPVDLTLDLQPLLDQHELVDCRRAIVA